MPKLLAPSEGTAGEMSLRLAGLVHALLFASPEPLTVDRLASVTAAARDEVRGALAAVARYYDSPNGPGGVALQEVAGGFQLVSVAAASAAVVALGRGRPQPLSPAALETLAIVAYNQPVTRAEVEAVRGVKVDGVIATLLERSLIREAGRKAVPGRPNLYVTTDDFLRFFGLRGLANLPEPEPDPSSQAGSDRAQGEAYAEYINLPVPS